MPPPSGSANPEWDDVTATFAAARASMAAGDMIHSDRFTLFSAMSAIELMDPKMDVGCGPVRDLNRIALPAALSDRQVVNIMDRLLACEATWLEAHTLAQTVFSCVYAHRVAEIPSTALFSFVRVQLATMDLALNLILDEKVAEEEDFVNWTHVFPFPTLAFRSAADEAASFRTILADARAQQPSHPHEPHARALVDAVALRLDFRLTLHRAMRSLSDATAAPPPPDTDALLVRADALLRQWADCPFRAPVDSTLLDHLFDSSINRHHMMATPPRTAPLMSTDEAIAYFQRSVREIRAALALRSAALRPVPSPRARPADAGSKPAAASDRGDSAAAAAAAASTTAIQGPKQQQRRNRADRPLRQAPSESERGADAPATADTQPRYSLQVALFALETFGATHNPRILTRSILSRLLIPQRSIALFADPAAMIPAMFRVDMCAAAARDGDAVAVAQAAAPLARRRRGRPARRGGDEDAVGGGDGGGDGDDGEDGEDEDADTDEDLANQDTLQEVVTGLLDSLLSNRSRLRRQLIRALQWWDRYAVVSARKERRVAENGEAAHRAASAPDEDADADADGRASGAEGEEEGRPGSDKENRASKVSRKPDDGAAAASDDAAPRPKSLRSKVAYEIECRLMALHWLLGFEVELYQDFEFVAVYFYVDYALTCLVAPSHVPRAAQPAARGGRRDAAAIAHMVEQVHPARHALARLDDGRRWLCRALSTFLHALSDSERFSYTCVRGARRARARSSGAPGPQMFGGDELWFEQRFGAVRGLSNGPVYAGHALFKSYARMQDESLVRGGGGSSDVVLLRLEEASGAFQEARLLLGRAKKMGERFDVATVGEEAYRLAAVAVQNSVAVARAIAMYKDGLSRVCDVRFHFSKHKHFAIVELDDDAS